MKNTFFVVLSLAFAGTMMAQNNKFVTLRADISNRNGDLIYIREHKNILKKIGINREGFFKDTLSIKTGIYQLYDGIEYTDIYLKNGSDLKIKADGRSFDKSATYEGTTAEENNYLTKRTATDHEFQNRMDAFPNATLEDYKKELDTEKAADLKALNEKKMDPEFVALETKVIEADYEDYLKYFSRKLTLKELNNTVPPPFEYMNYNGGTTKSEYLKGKFVYVDIWATWCGPCRAELPYLKKLEEKYHGKDIQFVSISLDQPKDIEKWRNMVKAKQMKGIQLFANETTRTPFFKYLKLSNIPRFVILDKEGKIINADANKPSSKQITSDLDKLLK